MELMPSDPGIRRRRSWRLAAQALPGVGLVISFMLLAAGASAAPSVRVVATTEDLAALTREVGGDRVIVDALARGYQDPHLVEPKPSFILKLLDADLLIVVGRDLEIAWLPALVQQSRNARIQPGAPGYLDASLTARILEIPTAPVTRAMGDVHVLGNPHYWLDPGNGRRIARAIAARLAAIRPADAAYFEARADDFERRLSDAEQRWDRLMASYDGIEVVTYHRTWSNFAERFGVSVVGYVEPKPGIPPSPAHIRQLVDEMVRRGVRLLLVEPYFDLRTPDSIARQTGAQVLVLSPSVGGAREASDYIRLFDYNLGILVAAIESSGSHPHHDHDHHRRRP
jgi:ABC-type Zn uptake system ZnuABC Zn-binding protein ZnuA